VRPDTAKRAPLDFTFQGSTVETFVTPDDFASEPDATFAVERHQELVASTLRVRGFQETQLRQARPIPRFESFARTCIGKLSRAMACTSVRFQITLHVHLISVAIDSSSPIIVVGIHSRVRHGLPLRRQPDCLHGRRVAPSFVWSVFSAPLQVYR
jgi:hypothetical protein